MGIRELNGGDCKTYLVFSRKTNEAALIDPLLNRTPDYLKLLKDEGLKLRYAVDTHTHADHLSGCADLMDRLDVEYVMGKGALPACVRRRFSTGDILSFGDVALRFIETPGHTTDSVSLVGDGALFSGDFLFIGDLGAGRLDLPGGDPAAHFESLKRLDKLPNDMRLLPGHDYQGKTESTLGVERKTNPVLSPRKRDAYLEWWAAKKFGPAEWMKGVVRANMSCTLDPDSVVIPKSEGTCAAACASVAGHPTGAVPQVSAVELKKLLADKKRAPFLLDVRGVEEYEGDGRIAGSALIPLSQLSWRLDEIPEDRVVVAICSQGGRATQAALQLKAAGREKVMVLTGGMAGWSKSKA